MAVDVLTPTVALWLEVYGEVTDPLRRGLDRWAKPRLDAMRNGLVHAYQRARRQSHRKHGAPEASLAPEPANADPGEVP